MADSNSNTHRDPRTEDEENKFACTDELSTSSEDEDTEGDHHSSTRDFDIAKYENEMVEYSRAFVMTVIMMVAISMSLITFVVVRNGEEADYRQHVSPVQCFEQRLVSLLLPSLASVMSTSRISFLTLCSSSLCSFSS